MENGTGSVQPGGLYASFSVSSACKKSSGLSLLLATEVLTCSRGYQVDGHSKALDIAD